MLRYAITAVFVTSALSMTVLALLQHRRGRINGSGLGTVVGGATSTLAAAGVLVLP